MDRPREIDIPAVGPDEDMQTSGKEVWRRGEVNKESCRYASLRISDDRVEMLGCCGMIRKTQAIHCVAAWSGHLAIYCS